MGNASDIEAKVELAAVRHLNGISSLISGITIHAGLESAGKTVPCVVCSAEPGAEEAIYDTGQYIVDLNVLVESNADDTTPAAHRDRVARVREEFMNDWIGASMSAHVSDFTAVAIIAQKSSFTKEDRSFVTTIPMRVHCRPSD